MQIFQFEENYHRERLLFLKSPTTYFVRVARGERGRQINKPQQKQFRDYSLKNTKLCYNTYRLNV